jgi:hypothetical protein
MYGSLLRLKDESATLQLAALRKAFYVSRNSDASEEIPIAYDFGEMTKIIAEENDDIVFTGEYYKTGEKAGHPKTIKGENNGKLSSVLSLMNDKRIDSRYKFMFTDKSQSYLHEFIDKVYGNSESNIKIIDLSETPHEMVPVLIAIITKLIYSVHLRQSKPNINPVCFMCDEAHVYIPSSDFGLGASQRRLLDIFETIAKEGRKFGATLCIISQRPSELNKTIMAQCVNFIVMKMTNEADKSMMKSLLPDSSRGLMDAISLFMPGDCIVIGDCAAISLKTRIDLPKEAPLSNTIDVWDAWGEAREIGVGVLVDGLLEGQSYE